MLTKEQILLLKECKTNKKIPSEDQDSYFPTKELRELGFLRKTCEGCSTYFWTIFKERKIYGDPACVGGFQVAGKTLLDKLSNFEVWNKIVEIWNTISFFYVFNRKLKIDGKDLQKFNDFINNLWKEQNDKS